MADLSIQELNDYKEAVLEELERLMSYDKSAEDVWASVVELGFQLNKRLTNTYNEDQ